MARKVFRRSVTTTSTTLSDLGEIGDRRVEGAKTYRLVYTVATQAAKALLALDSADASLSSFQVQVQPSQYEPMWGVNDTGASIAGSTYFWSLVEGPYVVDSTVLTTLAAVAAESPLFIDADDALGSLTTVASLGGPFPIVGQSLVSIVSVATTQGTPTVLIKGIGA